MQEYYIRKSEESDARGPFSLEQLSSLAETGQVDGETSYYDVDREEWLLISSNEKLQATLFPAKRKLRVKPKEAVPSLNATIGDNPASDAAKAEIKVSDMLEAAEGLSTGAKAGPAVVTATRTRAAEMGLQMGALLLLAHAGVLGLIEREVILSADFSDVLSRPLFLAALADFILGFVLFLGTADAYPVVRFRAFAMLGFLMVAFGFAPDPWMMGMAALFALSSYTLTLLTNLMWILIVTSVGLLGVAGMAYISLA